MQLILAAIVFGSACAADGCLVGAALAAVLLGLSPLRWSLLFGTGHVLLMCIGVFVTGVLGAISVTAAASLTLLGSSLLLAHVLRSERGAAKSSSCCSCSSAHKQLPRGSRGFRSDFVTALAMSGDALVGGIAFRGLFPNASATALVLACCCAGLVTGTLVYFAICGVRWTLIRVAGEKLRRVCLCVVCAVLGSIWLTSLGELLGAVAGQDAQALQPGLGILGGITGTVLCLLSLRGTNSLRKSAVAVSPSVPPELATSFEAPRRPTFPAPAQ